MSDKAYYTSQSKEQLEVIKLTPTGTLPNWIRGTLLRNGPALFEAGSTQLRHWFDGYGMIHSFVFQEGEVFYHSRFIQSQEYLNTQSKGVNTQLTWGTASDPCRSIFRRFMCNLIIPPTNTPVSIARVEGKYFATSDIGAVNEFDSVTLDTLSTKLNGGDGIMAAHPAFLPSGEVWNMKSLFVPFSDTTFVKMTQEGIESKSSFRTNKKYYFHSFGSTDRYLVSIEQPMYLSISKVLTSGIFNRSYFECYDWDKKATNTLHILDISSGEIMHIQTPHSFFYFHTINSYQEGDILTIDFCGYQDNTIINQFYLDVLQNTGIQDASKARLMSLIIDLVTHRTILTKTDVQIELPAINQAYSAKPYRYLYGMHSSPQSPYLSDAIIKYDKNTQASLIWKQEDLLPGEPIFVAKPGSTDEDDGVLLTVCYDTQLSQSSLVVLDAKTLLKMLSIPTPNRIPSGLHGNFYSTQV